MITTVFQPKATRNVKLIGRLVSPFLLAVLGLFVFMWLMGFTVQAADNILYVASSGSGGINDCQSSLDPCNSIQLALDNAVSGNIIKVAGGTYNENLTLNTQNISLVGGFTTSDWINSDPESNNTIIDGQNAGRVITITSAAGAVIDGFDIRNGQTVDDPGPNDPLIEGGGGIFVHNSLNVTIRNNVLHNNDAFGDGGAIYINSSSQALIEANEIYNNSASNGSIPLGGGGIFSTGSQASTIRFNKIYSNTASGQLGGGVASQQGDIIIEGNIISGNDALLGGGIYILGGDATIQNNILHSNTANKGGAIYNRFGDTISINHNTIVDNTATDTDDAGGIFNFEPTATLNINNTIIYNNSNNGIHSATGSTVNINYSTIIDPISGTVTTANPVNGTPIFVDAANDDYHLGVGAPQINAADPASTATVDVDGEARPFSTGFDVGADESYLNVGSCFARVEDGEILTNLQAAINTANPGDTVKVAGSCTDAGTQVVLITKTIILRGGFSLNNWDEPTPSAGHTILDGQDLRRVVEISGDESVRPILDGFFITGGSAFTGAGILINGASPLVQIQNNIIVDNTAPSAGIGTNTGYGGGIALIDASGVVRNNTIYNNNALNSDINGGGGIYNLNGSPIIVNNIVANNSNGGGIVNIAGSPANSYNDVYNNTPANYSGLLAGNGSLSVDPLFVNPAGDDFHLQATSPVINRASGNANYTPDTDIDGDTRPQGTQNDMGADEATVFHGVSLSPAESTQITPANPVGNVELVHLHTIKNTGSVNDTFDLAYHTNTGWTTQLSTSPVSLGIGESATVAVTVTVPAGSPSCSIARTSITATSQTNGNVQAFALDTSKTSINPGATFVPDRTQNIDPGDTAILNHSLTNNASCEDSYILTMADVAPATGISGWFVSPQTGTATDSYTVTIPTGGMVNVSVAISMPATAEENLENIFFVTATSQEQLTTTFSVQVTDTVIANAISGDRFVSADGHDTINNCAVSDSPCRTIKKGVETVSVGNTVHVAEGTYNETNIRLNGNITLQGGWNSGFSQRDPDPRLTIIDGNNNDRVIWILSNNPTIQGFTIQNGNSSARGGGIYVDGVASPVVQGNIFANNHSNADGGGLAINNGSPSIKNNVFYNNSANNGGGIFQANGTVNYINNTLVENSSSGFGGGLYKSAGSATLYNTIIVENDAGNRGGGVYNGGGSLNMDYNNFYNNTAVSGNADSNLALGPNTLQVEPELIDPPNLDFHLEGDSPMIDVGDPATTNFIDFEDDLRPVDQGFDIGADEVAGCLAQIASTSQTFGVVQDAVDLAPEDDTVRISGYCRGVHSIEINGQTIYQTVHLTKPVNLSGGWRPDFSKQDQPNAILDAELMGRTLFISGNIGVNISSLTFVNGNATDLGGGPNGEDAGGAVYINSAHEDLIFSQNNYTNSVAAIGGGIYNHQGSPAFTGPDNDNVTRILTNTASFRGGGFYNHSGSPSFENMVIAGNIATFDGGGFYNESGQPHFDNDNNHIFSNFAGQNGGGFYNATAGNPLFNADAIYQNTATNGGGFYNASSLPFTVTNMLLFSNQATNNGGGLFNLLGNPTIWNITAHDNSAASSGGGIYNQAGSPEIQNTIVYQNSAASGGGIFTLGGSPTVDYNDVYDNTGGDYSGISAGPNSISADPLFDPLHPAGLYHLSEDSPAVDSGNPNTFVTSDIDADIRPSNQGFDIGADELAGCLAKLNNEPTIYGTVMEAIQVSNSITDVVKVAGHCRGVHTIQVGNNTISQTVSLTKSLTLQGGWSANPPFNDQNAITILDATNKGHVIYIGAGVQATIENFHIIRGKDGAVYNVSNAGTRLKDSDIYSNTAEFGAAIFNDGGNLIVERGNRIYDNLATTGGAGFYSNGGEPSLRNNFIYENNAVVGGGVYIDGDTAKIWHNTLVGNTATSGTGSGIYRASGTPDINGNIVMDGTGSGMHDGGGGGSNGYNNVVNNSGGNGTLSASTDIHDAPFFVDKINNDYRLEQDSPGIDAGDRGLFGLLLEDFESDIRPSHQTMDIGADEVAPYELGQLGTFAGCFARINEQPPIYGSLQYAVDLAGDGDIIDQAGLCRGVNTLGGTTQNLIVSKTLEIRGGWRPDFTLRDAPSYLYPEFLGPGVRLTSDATDSVIDRLRISGSKGGAIYNSGSNAWVKNNLFFLNQTDSDGAGIYNDSGDLRVWNNDFHENTAVNNGAGIYIAAGDPVIRNNIFMGNTAVSGSAIHGVGGSPDIDYNNTWDNTLPNYGGTVITGPNAVYTNPQVISDLYYDDSYMKLSSLSYLRERGDPNTPISDITDDFEGHPRPSEDFVDIGADEYAACLARLRETGVIYGRVQEAVAIANTYTGTNNIDVYGHCKIQSPAVNLLNLVTDINFIGGWNETFDGSAEISTLNGDNNGHVGRVINIQSNTKVSFKGFEIINGDVTSFSPAEDDGGAIYNQGELTLDGPLAIYDNLADNGGAIYNNGILNIYSGGDTGIYSNTTTTGNGGGIYNDVGGELDLIGNGLLQVVLNSALNGGGVYNKGTMRGTGLEGISYNEATTGNGGGIYNDNGIIIDFTNGVFEQNRADSGEGGGIYNDGNSGSVTLTNIYFYGNRSDGDGGGFYNKDSNLNLYHLTVTENNSQNGSGGGIYNDGGTLLMSNTIVYSNQSSSGGGGLDSSGGASVNDVDYSNFYANDTPQSSVPTGTNSISQDPRLKTGTFYGLPAPVVPFSTGFVPKVTSPSIDAGDPDSTIYFDCCGNIRPRNAGFDQGIVEVYLYRTPDLIHIFPGDTPPGNSIDGLHTQYADPGQTVVFTHTLQNAGSVTDTFDIAIYSATQPWTATLMTPPTATLPSLMTTTVLVSVTVPPGTLAQLTNDLVISATSQASINDHLNNPGANVESDQVTDRVIVNTLIDFEISSNEGYGAPNDVLTYTHTITNNSNITDSEQVNLFMNPQYADMLLLGESVLTIPMNTNTTVDVQLTIPDWLAGGIDDKSQIILKPVLYPTEETAGVDTTHISYTVGTRHISPNGNDGDNSEDETVRWNNCTNPVVAPCRTITHTLEQAASGDVIKLAQGSYNRTMTATVNAQVLNQVVFLNQNQTLQGGYQTTNWDDSEPLLNPTIINAGDNKRGIFITGTIAVTLDGLHISNGAAYTAGTIANVGGGIYNNGADLVLSANAIYDNAGDGGGGVYHTGGSLNMFNNTVYNNTHGGLHIDGGETFVDHNTWYNNTTTGGGGGGGLAKTANDGNGAGIYLNNGDLVARNNIFEQNTASQLGGAIYIGSGAGGVTIDTNLFHNNSSDVSGATNTNAINDDPQLIDPANGDFHIPKGSPAEDQGLIFAGIMSEDFERDIRPQVAPDAYDIGADERLHIQGVKLEPDNITPNADFDELIVYTHTITNTGEDPDIFTITARSTQGWADLSGFPYTVTLGISGTAEITVAVTTGPFGSGGLTDYTVLTATSKYGVERARKLIFDTAVNTTTVAQSFAVNLSPNRSKNAFPGQVISYVHTLENGGDGPDTYDITAVSGHGWTTMVDTPVTLPALASTAITVTLNIPFGTAGQVDTMLVTATSTVSPVHSATVQDTTTVTGTVTPGAGVSLVPDNSGSFLAGNAVIYTHTLTNEGNALDLFNLSAVSSQGWAVVLNPTGSIALNSGQSTQVEVSITIPGGTGVDTTDVTTVTARSTLLDPSVSDSAINTTTVTDTQTAGVSISPNRSGSSLAGEVIHYQHTVTNNGNGADSFTLGAVSSQGWDITITPSQTVQLNPGANTQIDVAISVPATATVNSVDVSTVTATSAFDSGVSDSVVDTTTITDTRIISLSLVPDRLGTGQAGQDVTYQHTLTNLGNGTDSFTLSGASISGWTVTVTPTNVTLGVGVTSPVAVTVSIPSGTPANTQDIATITAASVFSPAVTASANDTTTVTGGGISAGVSLEPNNSFTILAGETVYYTHTLTNEGTDTDTFSLSSNSSQGWSVTLNPSGPVTLNSTESSQIEVSISVPGATPVDTVDNTTVTARSSLDTAVSDDAINTTTITDVRSAGVLLTPNRTNQNSPGSVVIHQHTLTNLGNATDSFSLTTTTNTTWTTSLTPGPISLAPNQSQPIQLSVTIPANATANMSATSVITATSSYTFGTIVYTPISDTVTDISIAYIPPPIYLPLILKNYSGPQPTATPTATNPGPTNTPTNTATATATNPGPTNTPTNTATATATSPGPTSTPTNTPSATPVPKPDLIITDISFNGATNEATITVLNQGNQVADSWFFVDLYVDRVPTGISDLGDYYAIAATGLGAGASTTVTLMNVNLSAGSHNLYAQVDTYDGQSGDPAYGNVQESNESNNVFGPVNVSAKNIIPEIERTVSPQTR